MCLAPLIRCRYCLIPRRPSSINARCPLYCGSVVLIQHRAPCFPLFANKTQWRLWTRKLSLAVEFREPVKTIEQQHPHLQTLSSDIVCKRVMSKSMVSEYYHEISTLWYRCKGKWKNARKRETVFSLPSCPLSFLPHSPLPLPRFTPAAQVMKPIVLSN